jgi:RimJ/RimL family protein N-acetyltransferase
MESTNLIIRETIFSDCELFAKWEIKDHVQEGFTMSKGRCYEEIVKEYVIGTYQQDKLQFTIIARDSQEPIGRIFIRWIDTAADSLDITRMYIGNESYLGKGFGEEAMRLILEHCYINLHTERVTIEHISSNARASSLYKKMGFKYEGILRNAGKKNGRYMDLHLLSMLRAEYFEKFRTIV